MTRGRFRIYLGAAPGVGKTFAMLNEGRRRAQRGTDVVVGIVETHGRPMTIAQVVGLEVLPRRRLMYRDAEFEEMDVDAIIERKPAVVLVDELAHTNVPGSRHEKRYQDVIDLLDAGIDVISTLNIQHLESVNDVVEVITGVRQQETIPDAIVRSADQIELVDMSPESLRRRMAHGNIYRPEKVDAALANYFREGNLSALREIALLWVADRVDDALRNYRQLHRIDSTWETRERVLVALTGAPGSADLARRAARLAQRSKADLLALHVKSDSGLRATDAVDSSELRDLVIGLGGEYRELVGTDVARSIVEFARSESATQIVIGATRRSRWRDLVEGSVVNSIVRDSGEIDVHIISDHHASEAGPQDVPQNRSGVSARRRLIAFVLAAFVLPLLTAVMVALDGDLNLGTEMLAYVLIVLIVAVIGGLGPALVTAVASSILVNYWFTPPIHTFRITEPGNVLSFTVFCVVAFVTSLLVSSLGRQTAQARRAQAQAETLASVVTVMLPSDDAVQSLVTQLRDTFDLQRVAVVETTDGSAEVIATANTVAAGPDVGEETVDIDDCHGLLLVGRPISSDGRRVLGAFVAQLRLALERDRMLRRMVSIKALEEADRLRTSILRSVSHDLRSPLAAIKASVTSLQARDVEWDDEAREAFLDAIDAETDRLNSLVGNLLDMSRLESGSMQVRIGPVVVGDVVASAIRGLGPVAENVVVGNLEDLPNVEADPFLLERVIVNLVDNALRHGASDTPVRIDAATFGSTVGLRVVDYGRGIPPSDRMSVFEPFQRLGDTSTESGLGLGLAVARGFVLAMDGALEIEDTPGGGITIVITLRSA